MGPTGDDPRRCTATSKHTGQRCGAWAVGGTHVCRMHGGAAPQVRAAARRRLDEQKAEQQVRILGLPRQVDPHIALLEEVHRTAGHVAYLNSMIGDFDTDAELKQYTRDKGGLIWEKPAVWVEIYQHERTHLARVAKAALDAGVQERQVKLAEQQGQLIAQVLQGVLADLGVADHPEAGSVVRKHLAAASTFSPN